MDSQNKEQLVSLKVMRLLKPSLYSSLTVFTEDEHFSDNFSKLLLDQTFNTTKQNQISLAESTTTDFLVIPQIFGNLYIGETFTSYICLHNQSLFNVKSLSIKVELQTSTQKISLPFKSNVDYVEDFGSDHKFDGIVEHDVKELGNHILICFVSYMTEKLEKMQFKKFYKFLVSKPFEIQPRFPFVEPQNISRNTILFEAQIQNITNSILFMENVQLLPIKETIHVEELENKKDEQVGIKQVSKHNFSSMLKPSEVKQYLFKVRFDNIEVESKPLVIGRLDINWRNSFGEIGRLQTHPLTQTAELYNFINKDIELTFSDFPSKIEIDEAVNFKCHVKNISERELDLCLKLNGDKRHGYIWNCNLTYEIGKMTPKSVQSIRMSIVPYQIGLLSLSGISITDLFLKRLHEFTQVYNFCVTTQNEL